MKKVLALILALVLILTSLVSLTALADDSLTEQTDDPLARYVNTGNTGKLNVRSSIQTYANNVITKLENGTRVVILEYLSGNTWVKVEFPLNGKIAEGYVQNRYLSTTKPAAIPTAKPAIKPTATPAPSVNTLKFNTFKHVEPTTMTVKPSTPGGYVNLRWGPSKAVSVMDKLYADAQVLVIAKNNTWAQVLDPATGYVGFMMLSFLKQ